MDVLYVQSSSAPFQSTRYTGNVSKHKIHGPDFNLADLMLELAFLLSLHHKLKNFFFYPSITGYLIAEPQEGLAEGRGEEGVEYRVDARVGVGKDVAANLKRDECLHLKYLIVGNSVGQNPNKQTKSSRQSTKQKLKVNL